MLKPKIEKALNNQVNYEIYSAHLYLSMSSYFNSIDLDGFAHWMEIQYQEEIAHAMKIKNYIQDRDGVLNLSSIEAPPNKWKSALHIFTDTYKHEQKVTGLINDLMTLAVKENDHATQNFLQWFVGEQVEEESNVSGIEGKLKLAKGDPSFILTLDLEMGKRVFTPPPA